MLEDPANAGAVMNPPFSSEALLRGMKSLGRMTDLLGPYQAGGAYVLRSWANANSRRLENYIRAYVESLRWIVDPANRDAAIDILVRELALARPVAEAAFGQLADPAFGFTPDARLSRAGVDNMLATRAETGERDPRLDDRASWIDESWYRRALADTT